MEGKKMICDLCKSAIVNGRFLIDHRETPWALEGFVADICPECFDKHKGDVECLKQMVEDQRGQDALAVVVAMPCLPAVREKMLSECA